MALKVADGDEFLLAISIHVSQAEPAVSAALVIAQFGFFAPGGALENHDSIVRRDTNLLDAVAIQVIDDVQRLEDRVLWRVRLPDEPRLVEALIVSEELEPTNFLIRPGVAPGHALQAFDVRQNFCPTFVITLQGGTQSPAAIKVERDWPGPGDLRFTSDRGRILCNKAQWMCAFGREDFYRQFATAG